MTGNVTDNVPVILPHHEEAEKIVLGQLLFQNDLIEECEDLDRDHFYIPVHGRIFEAIRRLITNGDRADAITLKPEFEHDEALKDVGGSRYLAQLAANIPTARPAPFVKRIIDAHFRRRLIYLSQDVQDAALDDHETDALAQIERTEAELFGMVDQSSADKGTDLASAFQDLDDPLTATPIQTGYQDLDRLIGGLMPGQLTYVAARPGMGKTSLALGIAEHCAVYGRPVGILSLEMPRGELAARLEASRTGVSVQDILMKRLSAGDAALCRDARASLMELPIQIDDRSIHVDRVLARARRMVRRHGVKLLIIDQLGQIMASGSSLYEIRTLVSNQMKRIAMEIGVPLIVLHQLNRAPIQRDDKRPTMADLRDSGALEQDADIIIMIHREEYYLRKDEPHVNSPEWVDWSANMSKVQGVAEIMVEKQRNGPVGIAKTSFIARTATFRDASRHEGM